MTGSPAAGASLTVSLSNPKADRVKGVHALTQQKSARSRAGLHVAEGPQAAREAVRFAPVRDLYVSESALLRHADIAHEALERGLHVHVGTDDVLAAMSGDAQGILATVGELAAALADAFPAQAGQSVILVEARDPGNAGTIIRTADAAGAGGLVLAGDSVDPASPKVVRSTAGSLYHLPVVTGESVEASVAAARAAGMTVVAADGGGGLALGSPAAAALLAAPVAWMFGNEARGLAPEHLSLADATVRIPIAGKAESLNLAAAAAVCLYARALAVATE